MEAGKIRFADFRTDCEKNCIKKLNPKLRLANGEDGFVREFLTKKANKILFET